MTAREIQVGERELVGGQAGERVVAAALASRALLDELGMSPDEIALAEIDPRYSTASTASRADAFLLPDSLHFAEYNAESPAVLRGAEATRAQ